MKVVIVIAFLLIVGCESFQGGPPVDPGQLPQPTPGGDEFVQWGQLAGWIVSVIVAALGGREVGKRARKQ